MGYGILLKYSEIENNKSPSIILLTKDMTTIGRKGDITIDTSRGKEISKIHSKIYRRSHRNVDIWIIEDNKSLNGTFVNNKKISRVFLNHGDEIVFGGGSGFNLGDVVSSTDMAQCRYLFYLPPPIVKFYQQINLNASLVPSDLLDICSICLSPTIAPQELPCCHRFCLSCIHEWVRVCNTNMKPCICPMCRKEFSQSYLLPEEAMLSTSELKIYNVEPILVELDLKNCKQIKKVNILKSWTDRHKRLFYRLFNIIKNNPIRRTLFLHLTKATLAHVVRATPEELINGIKNFSETPKSNDIDSLRLQLLFIIFKELIYFDRPVAASNKKTVRNLG